MNNSGVQDLHSPDSEKFRLEVRNWLETNCPPLMRTPGGTNEVVWGSSQVEFSSNDQRLWFERMRDRGWFAPDWPAEFGGGGLNVEQVAILSQEMSRMKCRAPQINLGMWMLGPVLLELASDEQKRRFLVPMARGEVRWCQGFSEPNAGSDLASLKTAARDAGDHFVISGSKIWTSGGDKADWMYALVRTDSKAPKHQGISLLLLDMKSPGVSVRPIALMSGASEFCQVFFDDVRVPKENLIGPLNGGWSVAKKLLQHERAAISKLGELNLPNQVDFLPTVRRLLGKMRTPGTTAIRMRASICAMDDHVYQLTMLRMSQEANVGKDVSGISSIAKLVHTELEQRKSAVMIDVLGDHGLGWEGRPFLPEQLRYTRQWLLNYCLSIGGGTSEIQLNIIAKRILGLPGA